MTGKAIIFCAPSGAGKTTIVRYLLKTIQSLKFSISATTRSPRINEVDGEDYHFISKIDFLDRIEKNEILEWQEVYQDVYYGTLRSEIDRIWAQGNHVVFDVDVQGAINLKKEFGNRAISIFIKVDKLSLLRDRLKDRGTETGESLNERVNKAVEEMKEETKFDEIIVNHDLELAFKEAEEIVTNFIA